MYLSLVVMKEKIYISLNVHIIAFALYLAYSKIMLSSQLITVLTLTYRRMLEVIIHFLEWESNSQPVALVARLCLYATTALNYFIYYLFGIK